MLLFCVFQENGCEKAIKICEEFRLQIEIEDALPNKGNFVSFLVITKKLILEAINFRN